jgi:hypothetical protein
MHAHPTARRSYPRLLDQVRELGSNDAKAFEDRDIPTLLFVQCPDHRAFLIGEQGKALGPGDVALSEFLG